ncbi:MAG: hypothetical protein QOK37_4750 [Thermoanaerobaculia bacterium]|nr:hypothetical protein [Thermoanaerobaculia bacterium]
MTTTSEIAAILLGCERPGGKAQPYESEDPGDCTDITKSIGATLDYPSDGGNVFAVSDLHLAAGKGPDGRFDGCENFYFDDSFRRFLAEANRTSLEHKSHTFVLNGDAIDFLRVTYVPGRPHAPKRLQRILTHLKIRQRAKRKKTQTPEEQEDFQNDFEEWRQILLRIGIDISVDDLDASVTDREEIYGLKTQESKSVLRLAIVMRGHPEFFEALADWLSWGNRILVVKGNHDLEWFWRGVRNYLRLDIAERLAKRQGGGADLIRDALLKTVLPNLLFADHAVLIDGDFFLEHGHPYDPVTRVYGENTVNEGTELNIPFGSFFNRYVLNFLELDYPNLDKIRPTPNVLPMILRTNGFGAIRVLATHLTFMFQTMTRGYVKHIFGQHLIRQVATIVAAIVVLPIGLLIHQFCAKPGILLGAVEWIVVLIAVHIAVQGTAQWQLKEPDSLAQFARLRFEQNPNFRLITFGHTHNPTQFVMNRRWFYNTGTWIPVIETTVNELRENRMFAILRIDHDGNRLQPGLMYQWDDEGGRLEPMVLIRTKSSDL